MNRIITSFALLSSLVFIVSGCSDSSTQPGEANYVAHEDFDFSFDIVNQTGFRLEGINGDISIEGRPDLNTIVITGTKSVRSESISDAEAHMPLLNVERNDLGDFFLVKTSQPSDSQGRTYAVDYDILLPCDFEVEINNVNGQINFHDFEGNLETISVNGTIEGSVAVPLNGRVYLSTINGFVDLDIPGNTSAEFEARVVNGLILLHNIELDDEHVSPHSVTGVMGNGRGSLIARVTNGTIDFTGF